MACAACEATPAKSIDPFPIGIQTSSGAIVGAVAFGDEEPVPVVIDTLSPVTIADPGVVQDPTRRRLVLTLHGVDANATPTVARARYDGAIAYDIHPCGDQDSCGVGLAEETVSVGGIVGFDILARHAVTIDFTNQTMTMSPDVAGDNPDRRRACEAEFPSAFAGGGTLKVGGDEQRFSGRRPAVRTCLAPGEGVASRDQGENALLVLSTGSPISSLSQSAYERYRASSTELPTIAELPEEVVETTSGRLALPVADIPGAAFLGQVRGERGACRELYANRIMALGGCDNLGIGDCPCPDNERFCRTGAAIVSRETVRFAIINDQDPALQALRDELRPGLPEVDGLLSARDFRHLRVSLDYPNGRMLMRCELPGACETRPVIVSQSQADSIGETCPEDPGPIDAGVDAMTIP